MGYLNEDGLARYDGLLKNWVTFKSGTVDGIDPLLNWQRTDTAGAVTFYPLPAAPIDPVVNFAFTETGPASGEKGPDNPSVIEGVESVKAGRAGKNILIYPYRSASASFDGLSATADNEGRVIFNGTKTTTGRGYISVTNGTPDGGPNGVPCDVVFAPGMQYTASLSLVSGSVSDAQNVLLAIIDHDAGAYITTCGVGNSVTFTPTHKHFRARLEAASGVAFSNVSVAPQLELGSTATPFEPYAGTDYTVNLGGTYYGGSVDLSSGTMTVTWAGYVLSSDLGLYPTSVSYTYRTNALGNATSDNPTGAACSHYQKSNNATLVDIPVNSILFRNDGMLIVKTDGLSLQQFKDFADTQISNGTPIVAIYPLRTPYAVPLTPTQIYSLSQSNPYTPRINTVYSDQTSVEVGYPKSPQATASELTNAIVSLGSNL